MGRRIQAIAAAAFTWATLTMLAGNARAQDVDACIAANEAALKSRKAGKLTSARAALATCAAAACPEAIRSSCQQRLGDLKQAIPSIVFELKDGRGNDVSQVRVTVDGMDAAVTLGSALELDPGPHVFRFEADGQPTVEKTLTLVEGVRSRREAIVLGVPPPPPPSSRAEPETGLRALQKWGVGLGSVGVAGVAIGAIFGALAKGSFNKQMTDCSSTATCSDHASALSDHSSAVTNGTVSTAAFVVGGALLVGGVVLVVVGRQSPAEPPPAALRAGPGSLALTGAF